MFSRSADYVHINEEVFFVRKLAAFSKRKNLAFAACATLVGLANGGFISIWRFWFHQLAVATTPNWVFQF